MPARIGRSTQVKRFAQHYDCHCWFVAHPRRIDVSGFAEHELHHRGSALHVAPAPLRPLSAMACGCSSKTAAWPDPSPPPLLPASTGAPLQNWQGQAPNLYDISGSAHFINKVRAGGGQVEAPPSP